MLQILEELLGLPRAGVGEEKSKESDNSSAQSLVGRVYRRKPHHKAKSSHVIVVSVNESKKRLLMARVRRFNIRKQSEISNAEIYVRLDTTFSSRYTFCNISIQDETIINRPGYYSTRKRYRDYSKPSPLNKKISNDR